MQEDFYVLETLIIQNIDFFKIKLSVYLWFFAFLLVYPADEGYLAIETCNGLYLYK